MEMQVNCSLERWILLYNRRQLGKEYEEKAKEFLIQRGYEILEQNYYSRWGEIDLIGRNGKYLVFIEVKYRKNTKNGVGFESVTRRKQKKICQTALWYLTKHHISIDEPIRFDIVSIDKQGDKEVFTLMQNGFEFQ